MAILVFAVLIIAAAVIFSTQNAVTVTLKFITWQFSGSLAIVIFLAVLAGMVIMGLLWTSASIKKSMKKSIKKGAKVPAMAAGEKDGAPIEETKKGP
jgi:uncharacterized integral membrane protein